MLVDADLSSNSFRLFWILYICSKWEIWWTMDSWVYIGRRVDCVRTNLIITSNHRPLNI